MYNLLNELNEWGIEIDNDTTLVVGSPCNLWYRRNLGLSDPMIYSNDSIDFDIKELIDKCRNVKHTLHRLNRLSNELFDIRFRQVMSECFDVTGLTNQLMIDEDMDSYFDFITQQLQWLDGAMNDDYLNYLSSIAYYLKRQFAYTRLCGYIQGTDAVLVVIGTKKDINNITQLKSSVKNYMFDGDDYL